VLHPLPRAKKYLTPKQLSLFFFPSTAQTEQETNHQDNKRIPRKKGGNGRRRLSLIMLLLRSEALDNSSTHAPSSGSQITEEVYKT